MSHACENYTPGQSSPCNVKVVVYGSKCPAGGCTRKKNCASSMINCITNSPYVPVKPNEDVTDGEGSNVGSGNGGVGSEEGDSEYGSDTHEFCPDGTTLVHKEGEEKKTCEDNQATSKAPTQYSEGEQEESSEN